MGIGAWFVANDDSRARPTEAAPDTSSGKEPNYSDLQTSMKRNAAAYRNNVRQLNSVQDEIATLRAELDGLQSGPERDPAMDNHDRQPPPMADLAEREQANQAFQRGFAARFDMEPVDPEWAHAEEENLSRSVTTLGPEVALRSISCRSSLCRLQIDVTNSEETQEQGVLRIGDLMSGPEFAGGKYFHSADEENGAVVYVFRKGRFQDVKLMMADVRGDG